MKIKYISLSFIIACLIYHSAKAQNDIHYVKGSTRKIEQLVGDYDRDMDKPTANRTNERFGVHATDLGVPFEHNGMTYVAFGDIPPSSNDRDPLAFTTDTSPENGMKLDFITNPDGGYRPVDIPGVSMTSFEVPMEGVSWNNTMYLYATTDRMSRSVVAKSTDDGYTFTKLYDLSQTKFVNVSIVKTQSTADYPEPENTDIQVMLGSGTYRQSNIFLAYQTADLIEQDSMNYFMGLKDGVPVWTGEESEAVAIVRQPCVGELSVSFNKFIKKWIVLYNCIEPRGINCRTADNPWGPWSDPFVIFNPDASVDKGYCYFMHSNWEVKRCDNIHDPGRENEWGSEYGPYQFENLAIGNEYETTIYYTMSTWNPYTVVLMKSTLRRKDTITTGWEADFDTKSYKVYPNPSTHRLFIESTRKLRSVSFAVRDLQGRVVFKKNFMLNGNSKYELETTGIDSGIYFLEIKSDQETAKMIRKVVVK